MFVNSYFIKYPLLLFLLIYSRGMGLAQIKKKLIHNVTIISLDNFKFEVR